MNAEREGMPWMPEEDLLVLVDGPLPERAVEAYEAIRKLRLAAISVVSAYQSGSSIGEPITVLEEALLAGVEPDLG